MSLPGISDSDAAGSVLDLVRDELRGFAGYASARRASVTGAVWLNANESPWRSPADDGLGVNRYPEPQPAALRQALATLYGVEPTQLLIGRGSDEAIELLVRALCRPGRDAVLIAPPVFGMYAVSARLQGAPLIELALTEDETGFRCDLEAVAERAINDGAKLVFLCSPANPTGQALTTQDIVALAARLQGHALLVVDEAYAEYSSEPSVAGLVGTIGNLAVLRTLSKAHALAAARIGVVIAAPELISVLRNCQAPYPVPTPCVELAMAALRPEALALTGQRTALTVAERVRVSAGLIGLAGVRRVYRSEANFLLVRFEDAQRAFEGLLAAGVVVRDMRAYAALGDALRISIGTPEENDAVLAALSGM